MTAIDLPRPTKDECLESAGQALVRGLTRAMSREPREAAERAYMKGGPSVEEIEAKIHRIRAKAAEKARQAA